MPEYLAPGVYVEEVEIGAKPIEGVSTSTAAFIGETERGPTTPRLITGFEQFRRLYGSYSWSTEGNKESRSFLPHAVEGFFSNGGKRCFVGPIVGKGGKKATLDIEADEGSKPPSKSVEPAPKAKKEKFPDEPEGESGANPEFPEAEPEGKKKKGNSANNPTMAFGVEPLGPGAWGNRIGITIEQASLSDQNPNLFKMVVSYWKDKPDQGELTIQEDYDNLSPNPASTDFYEKRINNLSSLIEVTRDPDAGDTRPEDKETFLKGGTDGEEVTIDDYKGAPGANPGERTGLRAFEEIDDISIVCAPNENNVPELSGVLVEHCEFMKDRFVVLQTNQSAGQTSKMLPPVDSKYAAYYFPWIRVIDPVTGTPKLIPPGGHIAGIYARTDTERGVHKAPANEVVRGAVGLQFAVTKGDQDILNPRGVNCIRAFSGRGIRVWGARTTSSDPLWKYVNVRRLFLFLEESIEEGTQWVVFEPNDQRLWARVRQTASDFLTRVWKDGALMGNTPDEAFFVKCDETTMTQNDIENGRLIVIIGVAPVRPAEFVIFRLAQWRGGSVVTE